VGGGQGRTFETIRRTRKIEALRGVCKGIKIFEMEKRVMVER